MFNIYIICNVKIWVGIKEFFYFGKIIFFIVGVILDVKKGCLGMSVKYGEMCKRDL